MSSIQMIYPELPPSSNRLYIRGSILRPEARRYRENFKKWAHQHHGHEILQMDPQQIYALHLDFHLPTAINESFYDASKPPSRRAQTPYKRIDLSNKIKLLEDCIKYAVGIDDSQTFESLQRKFHAPGREKVVITLFAVNRNQYGIP